MPTGLFAPVQGVHLREKAIVFRDPLILVMHVTRLNIDLDQLKNKETPKFMSMATSEFFLSFFLSSNSSCRTMLVLVSSGFNVTFVCQLCDIPSFHSEKVICAQ